MEARSGGTNCPARTSACFRLLARRVIDQSSFAGKDLRPWASHRSRCYTKLVLRNLVKTPVIKWPVLSSQGGRRRPALERRRTGEPIGRGPGADFSRAGGHGPLSRGAAHFWNAVGIERKWRIDEADHNTCRQGVEFGVLRVAA